MELRRRVRRWLSFATRNVFCRVPPGLYSALQPLNADGEVPKQHA